MKSQGIFRMQKKCQIACSNSNHGPGRWMHRMVLWASFEYQKSPNQPLQQTSLHPLVFWQYEALILDAANRIKQISADRCVFRWMEASVIVKQLWRKPKQFQSSNEWGLYSKNLCFFRSPIKDRWLSHSHNSFRCQPFSPHTTRNHPLNSLNTYLFWLSKQTKQVQKASSTQAQHTVSGRVLWDQNWRLQVCKPMLFREGHSRWWEIKFPTDVESPDLPLD